MNLHEEYQRCLGLFPLIAADQLFSPVASTKGSTGHGEGFTYGKHMRSDRTFFTGSAVKRSLATQLPMSLLRMVISLG